jgi:hypothetical protein
MEGLPLYWDTFEQIGDIFALHITESGHPVFESLYIAEAVRIVGHQTYRIVVALVSLVLGTRKQQKETCHKDNDVYGLHEDIKTCGVIVLSYDRVSKNCIPHDRAKPAIVAWINPRTR